MGEGMSREQAIIYLQRLNFYFNVICISLKDTKEKIVEIRKFKNTDGTELYEKRHFVRQKTYVHDYESMIRWLELVSLRVAKVTYLKSSNEL